jgi:hypothetical protein
MKKKEHKFNKNILFVTLLILLGLMLIIYSGIMLYDKHKKSQIEDSFSLLNQQIILDDLYNSYLDDVNSQKEKCDILNNQINNQLLINEQLYDKLISINKNAIVPTDNSLKYMFVLTNIKLWLHYQEINKECDTNINTMLFFYPEIEGYSLDKVKLDAQTKVFEKKLSKVLDKCNYKSFALPYIKYIPILDHLINKFDIKKAPAVYINGNVYYSIPEDINSFYSLINCDVQNG